MTMQNVGYYNGKLGPLEEMTVPMLDRAVYFGDGCYEAAVAAGGVIFALEEHLDRFYSSLALLRIGFAVSREELAGILNDCVAAAEGAYNMMYWQASRGTDYRHPDFPAADIRPNLMAMVRPYGPGDWDYGAKLLTAPDTRYLHCNIKTINLLPNVLASQRAAEAGCVEAVFIRGGFVTEGARSNIHILKDGVFITHPADNLILPGIARKHLLALCGENGIPVSERPFTPEEMLAADEVIVSSSGAFCMRASEIDGRAVGGRDELALKALQGAYREKFLAETGMII